MNSQLSSCVKLPNGLTGYFDCNIGTKQGCVSSTIIFALYINDLVTHLKRHCGSGVFVQIMRLCLQMTLQLLKKRLGNYKHRLIEFMSQSTGMQLNLDKSKIMVFRNGGPLRHYERWFYNEMPIEVVSFYRYLGSFFTPKLCWTKTMDTLAKQATKAMGTIFRYQKYFGYFNHKEAFKLFDTVVKPILMYSSELWGHQTCDKIEIVQVQFCKRLACLNQSVPNSFALTECGRLPLSVAYMLKCVKYWITLTQMAPTRYPRQCYVMLRRLDDSGRVTWATFVKRTLFSNGFGHAWISGEVENDSAFLTLFQNRLEKGRHMKIDRTYMYYRFCPICLQRNVYCIENEFHFLLVCPVYADIRERHFIDVWLRNYISEHLFVQIMSDTNIESIFALARYLDAAVKL